MLLIEPIQKRTLRPEHGGKIVVVRIRGRGEHPCKAVRRGRASVLVSPKIMV